MTYEAIRAFRDRFNIPVPDDKLREGALPQRSRRARRS